MNDQHNPDVLSCLANLSNDEVFTPPKVVNDMLDLLLHGGSRVSEDNLAAVLDWYQKAQ